MAPAPRLMFGEQQRFMLFLITPAALLLLLFQVVPIVMGANASFRDWALYNPKKIWVGLDHYRAVVTIPHSWKSYCPTLSSSWRSVWWVR